MLGRNIEHIVHALSRNAQPRDDQRLRVNLPIDANHEKLSEIRRIDIRRRQDRLNQILTGAGEIIVPGKNIGSVQCWCRRNDY